MVREQVVSASLLDVTLEELRNSIDELKQSVSMVHCDIMDGTFTPTNNLDTMIPKMLLCKQRGFTLDIHIMSTNIINIMTLLIKQDLL